MREHWWTYKVLLAKRRCYSCACVVTVKMTNWWLSLSKNESWWQVACGPKAVAMTENAPTICGADAQHKDVASLKASTPNETEKTDCIKAMATLAVCRVVDPTCTTPGTLLGDDTEHLYQLNHVYVSPPTKASNIKTNDGQRLFTRLEIWDHTENICSFSKQNNVTARFTWERNRIWTTPCKWRTTPLTTRELSSKVDARFQQLTNEMQQVQRLRLD